MLYVRCGDADGYNGFDDLESAIDYLQEMRVESPMVRIDRWRFESPNMKGQNNISMYWAKDAALPETRVSGDDLYLINIALTPASRM